jgi:hypothetical protein
MSNSETGKNQERIKRKLNPRAKGKGTPEKKEHRRGRTME